MDTENVKEPLDHLSRSEGESTNTEESENTELEEGTKLFIGQVPKTMDETDLFTILEKFGPMADVTIIRDKVTLQHRGCAFATFLKLDSAEACKNELHDKVILHGGQKPVQVRQAIKGGETDHKVFIGMLPNNVTEKMIEDVFSKFGKIYSSFIIRSSDGIRKDCAFVKYDNGESVSSAIAAFHSKMVFDGSDRPLIVKHADQKNSKKSRRQMVLRSEDGGSDHSYAAFSNPSHVYYEHSHHSHSPNMIFPHGGSSIGMSQYIDLGVPAYANTPVYVPQDFVQDPVLHPSYGYMDPRYQRPPMQLDHDAKPREGPAGANLFIYHLPHDLTDADLATAFNPFGNVISAKVFVDKNTGESKGFGFVSYDSIIAAEQAIDHMNGFQIGNKRLKVQHKRVGHRNSTPPLPGLPPVPAQHIMYYSPQIYERPYTPPSHTDYNSFVPSSINVVRSAYHHGSSILDHAAREFGSLKIQDEK